VCHEEYEVANFDLLKDSASLAVWLDQVYGHPVKHSDQAGTQVPLLPFSSLEVKRFDESNLVLGKDERVAHGSDEMVKQLKVDIAFIALRFGNFQLFVESLRDRNRVLWLGSEVAHCYLQLVLFQNLLDKVFSLIHDH